MSRNPYEQLKTTLARALDSSPIINHFYELFYSSAFYPDVNGYCLIFLQPPDLSGYGVSMAGKLSAIPNYISETTPLFATSISPPQTQVTTENVSAKFGSLQYATSVETTGQLNITFLDNQHITVFGFHKLWQDYIRDVVQGDIDPSVNYISEDPTDDFCEIDYMASAYVIRFRPSMGHAVKNDFLKNIVYIGKATGIFPVVVSDTEIIGRRDSPQLTIVPVTYSCVSYRKHVPQLGVNDGFNYILSEFNTLLTYN